MPILTLTDIPGGTFDTDTRQLVVNCSNSAYTGKIPTLPTQDEQVTLGLFLAIETNVAATRTNLNRAVSAGDDFSVPNPKYQFVSRANADGSASEVQVEYTPNLRLWFKDGGVISGANAVNEAD